MVDTDRMRVCANRNTNHTWYGDEEAGELLNNAADELDALRKSDAEKDKRISQLERLVCSYQAIGEKEDGKWVIDNLVNGESEEHDTSSAAIDAAIQHMEQDAGE